MKKPSKIRAGLAKDLLELSSMGLIYRPKPGFCALTKVGELIAKSTKTKKEHNLQYMESKGLELPGVDGEEFVVAAMKKETFKMLVETSKAGMEALKFPAEFIEQFGLLLDKLNGGSK